MSEKKTLIIETALSLLQEEGYPSLTMRNLAKHCDLKLASLQYHFKNWNSLIDAIADYLIQSYLSEWEQRTKDLTQTTLSDFIDIAFEDFAQEGSCDLWPQLWAMSQHEPAVKDALDKIYTRYFEFIAAFLEQSPHTRKEDALLIMACLEGLILFIGKNKAFAQHQDSVKKRLISQLTFSLGQN